MLLACYVGCHSWWKMVKSAYSLLVLNHIVGWQISLTVNGWHGSKQAADYIF